MIYFILFLMVFVIATIGFISKQWNWLVNHKISFYQMNYMSAPLVIEKAYKAHDLLYAFKYTYPDRNTGAYFSKANDVQFLHDNEHKQYLIKRGAEEIGSKMLSSGMIQVIEDRFYQDPPWVKTVELRAKVYIPE